MIPRRIPRVVTGILHGKTVTLDAPVPQLDEHRVRVIVEPADEDAELSTAENAKVWAEWAATAPQGPIEADDAFPDEG